MNKHTILVYGTLRPGNTQTRLIPGVMYNIGAFPGVKLDNLRDTDTVVVEEVEVDDAGLRRLDGYEGCNPDDPKNSLYNRVRMDCGSWLYVFNASTLGKEVVPDGDWLKFLGARHGSASRLVSNSQSILSTEA